MSITNSFITRTEFHPPKVRRDEFDFIPINRSELIALPSVYYYSKTPNTSITQAMIIPKFDCVMNFAIYRIARLRSLHFSQIVFPLNLISGMIFIAYFGGADGGLKGNADHAYP